MIVEYHRPETLQAALELLARSDPRTFPLGGGSALNKPSPEPIAVVDLQALGLDSIQPSGQRLVLGATVTLQGMLDAPAVAAELKPVIRYEATHNLRQVATLAGTLVASDGRSPLATSFLALDASLTLLPGEEPLALGDLLPMRTQLLPGRLISQVTLPVNARLAFHAVARTPADLPQVCVAAARWPSGRTRLAVGGYGSAPLLAFDGPDDSGAETAAAQAYSQAADQWASAEYRSEAAEVLARRSLAQLA